MKVRGESNTVIEADPHVRALAGAINNLGDLPAVKGPAQAYTENGTLYEIFRNGAHVREGEAAASWARDVSVETVCAHTLDSVMAAFRDVPYPRRVVWRAGPEFTVDSTSGAAQLYLRLVVEHVAPKIEEAPPEPKAAEPVTLAEKRLVPDDEVIATCERLLEWAKSGELRAIGYVTVRPGDMVGTGWDSAAPGNRHLLASGSAGLHHRIVRKIFEDGEPD